MHYMIWAYKNHVSVPSNQSHTPQQSHLKQQLGLYLLEDTTCRMMHGHTDRPICNHEWHFLHFRSCCQTSGILSVDINCKHAANGSSNAWVLMANEIFAGRPASPPSKKWFQAFPQHTKNSICHSMFFWNTPLSNATLAIPLVQSVAPQTFVTTSNKHAAIRICIRIVVGEGPINECRWRSDVTFLYDDVSESLQDFWPAWSCFNLKQNCLWTKSEPLDGAYEWNSKVKKGIAVWKATGHSPLLSRLMLAVEASFCMLVILLYIVACLIFLRYKHYY